MSSFSWTYTDDPTNVPADLVRMLVGDVDETEPLVSDGVVTYYLATFSSPYRAAAGVAGVLKARYARLVSKSLGPARVSLEQRYEHYKQLEADLKAAGDPNVIAAPVWTGEDSPTTFHTHMHEIRTEHV